MKPQTIDQNDSDHQSLVRSLVGLRAADLPAVGGKGANLGELIAAGLPVPPGFMVTTAAYDRFVEQHRLSQIISQVLTGLTRSAGENDGAAIRTAFEIAAIPPMIEQAIVKAYQYIISQQLFAFAILHCDHLLIRLDGRHPALHKLHPPIAQPMGNAMDFERLTRGVLVHLRPLCKLIAGTDQCNRHSLFARLPRQPQRRRDARKTTAKDQNFLVYAPPQSVATTGYDSPQPAATLAHAGQRLGSLLDRPRGRECSSCVLGHG